jgi:hypothetical protein
VVDAGEAVAGSAETGDEVIGCVDAGCVDVGGVDAGCVDVGCVDAGGAAVVFGACAIHAAETATSITDNFLQNAFMNDSLLP